MIDIFFLSQPSWNIFSQIIDLNSETYPSLKQCINIICSQIQEADSKKGIEF